MTPLAHGSVIWVDLNPTRGREQKGRRPALVIASQDYLDSVPDLVIVVPLTTTDRGWPHHVPVNGADVRLTRPSFAMTEQPRTIPRDRITRVGGVADEATLTAVHGWLRDFISPH